MPSVSLPDASLPDVEWQGAGCQPGDFGFFGDPLDLTACEREAVWVPCQLFSWFETA